MKECVSLENVVDFAQKRKTYLITIIYPFTGRGFFEDEEQLIRLGESKRNPTQFTRGMNFGTIVEYINVNHIMLCLLIKIGGKVLIVSSII